MDGFFLEILNRHEMQRLRGVRQLGLANLVFPGANHSRFEHCLGAYHLAGEMAHSISLSQEDSLAVRAAGLLHDICHAPFSHTLESIMEEATGQDHMELARNLVFGRIKTCRDRDAELFSGEDTIAEILDANGVDPRIVCDLIAYPETTSYESSLNSFLGGRDDHIPSKDYIHQIIHGPVDCDQMDYLMRDAHYTGVVMGQIDTERLLSTMRVVNDRICISRGGAPAAEGLMVSRSLMYTSVYFHPTVRIINRMITKAVLASDLDLRDIYLWDDSDLSQMLFGCGGDSARLMSLLQNRMFYKKAAIVTGNELDDSVADLLISHSSPRARSELERLVAEKAGVDESEVCIEIPPPSNFKSTLKIGKTDVSIVNEVGKVRSLTKTSSIAKALQARDSFGWSLVVACPERHREAVSVAASRLFRI
ncbi:MAG: HD domain-containing protein [archaeon]|nr:HD domain-containing protein [archaeon]